MKFFNIQKLCDYIKKHNFICWPVFICSCTITFLFIILCILFHDTLIDTLSAIQSCIITSCGWFYFLIVAILVFFCIAISMSRYGDIRLGKDHSAPKYSYLAWFAMLFSTGMGIGLIFYSVAEPISHFNYPPIPTPKDDLAKQAMSIVFFHWGINAWAVYAVVGLSLAYFSFRDHSPLNIRATLKPIFGDKINGFHGNLVDIIAIISCIFGVSTSLVIGAIQINSGLNHIYGIANTTLNQIIISIIVTILSSISVGLGLEKGMKRLSEINIILAIFLLLFVLFLGDTITLLNNFIDNIGYYFSSLIHRTFNLYSYNHQNTNEWLGKWTIFYWSWWISWSPFVGMFIARISKGRTIREFISGVLFVPAGFTFLWMTVFGNSALNLELSNVDINQNNAHYFYDLLSHLPWNYFSSLLATILIITFFITSADSGAYVIDIMSSEGKIHDIAWQRLFWMILIGIISVILIYFGGFKILQITVLIFAMPFTFVILLMCYSLIKSLYMERIKMETKNIPPTPFAMGKVVNWHKRLQSIVSFPKPKIADHFLTQIASPALIKVCNELVKQQDLRAYVGHGNSRVFLKVDHGLELDFYYEIRLINYDIHNISISNKKNTENIYCRAEVFLTHGSQKYNIIGYQEEQVINDLLEHYDQHMHYLHNIRFNSSEKL